MFKKLILLLFGILLLAACSTSSSSSTSQGPTGTGTEDTPTSSALAPTSTLAAPMPTLEPTVNPDSFSFDPPQDFRPDPDGFGFRNYTRRYPEGNLTLADARQMFGDQVCVRLEGDTCIPYPAVLTWVDDMNATMNSAGHCIGFTVASHQFSTGLQPLPAVDADATFALPPVTPVLHTISRGYASFFASNVWTQEVRGTPSEVLQALLLLDEPVDMGIYFPGYGQNGHSVLAYDVVDQGDGVYRILVYDNNRPGEENFIVVDTHADTWYYAQGAINPDQPSEGYQGDADTQSLTFVPLSAYQQPLECPADFQDLCGRSGFSVVTLLGRAQALVETVQGQIGALGSKLVNTIEGAVLVPVRGELFSRQQPLMLLPPDQPLSVKAQGTRADQPLTLSVAGPAFAVRLGNLLAQPDQVEQLDFDPEREQVAFTTGGQQTPYLEITHTFEGAIYQTRLSGFSFDAGQSLTFAVAPETGNLQIHSATGLDFPEAMLTIVRLDGDGEAVFASQRLALTDGALALNLHDWDGSGPLEVQRDTDGDGTLDTSAPLTNQPITEVIQGVEDATTVIQTLKGLTPYLDATAQAQVADVLPTLGFSPSDLGEAFRELPALQPVDWAAALADWNLSPVDIGLFIAALRLDPENTNAVLDALAFSEADQQLIRDTLHEQETLFDALEAWAFLNTDDPQQTLPDFLEAQDLSNAQKETFLNQADLPPETREEARKAFVATDENPGACSVVSDVLTSITFVNDTNHEVELYWVDYNCAEQSYGILAPGETRQQGTYLTHPWRVRDRATGALLPLELPDGRLTLTYVAGSTETVTLHIRR